MLKICTLHGIDTVQILTLILFHACLMRYVTTFLYLPVYRHKYIRPYAWVVVQVSKLERVLKEEKAAREQQVAELEAYAAQLEDELELEHRQRLSEQLCALIEGAPFIMYKSSEVSERHVWFRSLFYLPTSAYGLPYILPIFNRCSASAVVLLD